MVLNEEKKNTVGASSSYLRKTGSDQEEAVPSAEVFQGDLIIFMTLVDF